MNNLRNLTNRKEFIFRGEVYKSVPGFPNYYVSDCATVVSKIGSPKVLKATQGKVTMSLGSGYKRTLKTVEICALAFR